jgi:glycosyltransferase involved in cell wall biosynthesis
VEPTDNALICVTTCERSAYLRRCLPHLAQACAADRRFSLLVSVDGSDPATLQFCERWGIPVIHSEAREGVGMSKNRALALFGEFDHYFFIEDDVELLDASVFPQHIAAARASGIHHFSLFRRTGIRKRTHSSTVGDWHITHCLLGSASFNFFTAAGLRRVGGWHPRFAEFRRGGHTEHSYRLVRAGLAPAPFNLIGELHDACIWHIPPSVTSWQGVAVDADEIAAPERELMAEELDYVPVQTLSRPHFNGAPFDAVGQLAATLDAGDRYPLLSGAERREAWSDYHLWRFESGRGRARRATALIRAAGNWPANPMLRHAIKTALRA